MSPHAPCRINVRQLLVVVVLALVPIREVYLAVARHRIAAQLDALDRAVGNGNSAKVRQLVESGIDPRKSNSPAGLIIRAAARFEPATVQTLIDHGLNVNLRADQGESALSKATFFRRCDMVELLLKNGADVGQKDWKGRTIMQRMDLPAHPAASHDNDARLLRILRDAELKRKKSTR